MENLKPKIYIAVGVVMISTIIVLLYFLFKTDKTVEPISNYPESVQNAINNPVEKNENWSTLVDNEEYQISYSTSSTGDSFFITVNAEPVIEVSQKAEKALQEKLGADNDYLCTLPIIINIPSMLNDNLAEYNFGLSFCPGRIHIADVVQEESASGSTEVR